MQAARLGRALVSLGHDVTILTKHPVVPTVASEAVGVRVQKTFSFRGIRGAGKYAFAASLFAELVRQRPEVIHVHQLVEYHLMPSIAAAALLGCPVVAKASGGGGAERNSDLLWLGRNRLWGRKLVAAAAAGVSCGIAVSTEMAEELAAAGFRRIERIPNGVQVGIRPVDLAAPLDVVYVGRLHRVKGVDVLLDAWGRIQGCVGRSSLALVGEGPAEPVLRDMVRCRRLERVHFVGQRPRPLEKLSNAVFVLPSRSEGLSNALLEAMGLGMPVVATAVGGTRDVVHDGETGLLVRSEDPEGLAHALRRLITDVAFARKLGRAAHQHTVDRYSIEQIARSYERLYKSLLVEAASRQQSGGRS